MFEASSFPLALVPGHSSDAALVHMAAVSVRRLEQDLSAAHQISYEFWPFSSQFQTPTEGGQLHSHAHQPLNLE